MSSLKKISSGSVITIPLKGRYIIGLIIRAFENKMLCFFYSCSFQNIPELNQISLENTEVIFIKICSDLGFKKGDWRVIGKYENWKEEDWKIPVFKRKDLISGVCYEIIYNDKLEEISNKRNACKSLEDNPEDGLAGFGFVEKKLQKLIQL